MLSLCESIKSSEFPCLTSTSHRGVSLKAAVPEREKRRDCFQKDIDSKIQIIRFQNSAHSLSCLHIRKKISVEDLPVRFRGVSYTSKEESGIAYQCIPRETINELNTKGIFPKG